MKKSLSLLIAIMLALSSCGQNITPAESAANSQAASDVVATIKNGVIRDFKGNIITRQELNQMGYQISQDDVNKSIDVQVLRNDLEKALPTLNIKNDAITTEAYRWCTYDFNNNNICEDYDQWNVYAKQNFHATYRQMLYDDGPQTCWNPSAIDCTFYVKSSRTGTIKGSITGKYTTPIKVEVGANIELELREKRARFWDKGTKTMKFSPSTFQGNEIELGLNSIMV